DVTPGKLPLAKIFLRALLYSTGKRGHVIENMFVVVQHAGNKCTFGIWGLGDQLLTRGSGLFVGETGNVTNHHFNPPHDTEYFFSEGKYVVEIFVVLVGSNTSQKVSTVSLEVPQNLKSNRTQDSAIWFDWQPDTQSYLAH